MVLEIVLIYVAILVFGTVYAWALWKVYALWERAKNRRGSNGQAT